MVQLFAFHCTSEYLSSEDDLDKDCGIVKSLAYDQAHLFENENVNEFSFECKQEDTSSEHRVAEEFPSLDLQNEEDKIQ